MAKQGGLGDQLFVGGYDLGDDIGSVGNISGGPAPLEVTGITKEAFQRIGGVRSGRMELSAFFNDAADQAHEVLSALPTADTILTYLHGVAIGDPAACLNAKQVNYDPSRAQDGGLLIGVEAQSNQYGLEWGVQLTPGKRTDTGANSSVPSHDHGAETAFGGQAYFQVFSFVGTDATIVVRGASDSGFSTGLQDQATLLVDSSTPQAARVESVSTVRQHLKINTTTTGGFTSLVFAVAFVRNETAVTF